MVETITPVVTGDDRQVAGRSRRAAHPGRDGTAAVFGARARRRLGRSCGAPWGAAGLVGRGRRRCVRLAEAFGSRVPVPQARRQVPDWWRSFFSFPVFAFLYGAGLGVGFLTYLSRGTLLVVSAACVASGRPLVGAALMAPFGLARSAVVLLAVRLRTTNRRPRWWIGLPTSLARRCGESRTRSRCWR